MKVSQIFMLVLFASFLSCATGKNAFDKGDYQTALDRAINRLQSNPENEKAKQVLVNGYATAARFHLKNIDVAAASNDPFRWESIFSEYSKLNGYFSNVQRCPACMSLVKPNDYFTERERAGEKAAAYRIEIGKEALAENSLEGGRQAYVHFQNANAFARVPGLDDLIMQAREMGTLRVLVEPIPMHSRNLELTNDYFENRMFEYLDRFSQDRLVRFFKQEELEQFNMAPDHILSLAFDDFVIGQVSIVSNTKTVEKDSVVVGSYTDDEGKTFDVLGSVKAKFTAFNKTIASAGVVNFEIKDASTGRVLAQRKLAEDDIWVHQWGQFNGDERALTKDELRLAALQESPPPLPQELFAFFIDKVYDQITAQIRMAYRRE